VDIATPKSQRSPLKSCKEIWDSSRAPLSTVGIGADEQARSYEFNALLHNYTDIIFCEG